jgi:alpha-L-rhamnosidase
MVHVQIADVGLDWCRGKLLTPDGPVELAWQKDNGGTTYHAQVPAGYTLQVENLTGRALKLR